MSNIRKRNTPEYKELSERFRGWVIRKVIPYGAYSGTLSWMMNYEKLEEADPNELNNYISMYCEDPSMMVFGLNRKNKWKFREFLEALSYSRNTVVFKGDAWVDEIFDMADVRVLYIPSGIRLPNRWFDRLVNDEDQWIFEIGDMTDLTQCINRTFRQHDVPFVYAMPKWQPNTEDPIEKATYLYKYLSHAYRISEGLIMADLPQIRVCLDLWKVLITGNKGDPEYLRTKVHMPT